MNYQKIYVINKQLVAFLMEFYLEYFKDVL
jgi:hypothetical protein